MYYQNKETNKTYSLYNKSSKSELQYDSLEQVLDALNQSILHYDYLIYVTEYDDFGVPLTKYLYTSNSLED